MAMIRTRLWAWVLLTAACLAAVAEPRVERSLSEVGLEGWRLRDSALDLEIIQRLPDQTRAFFEARGFGPAAVDHIARTCVMQAILRNLADAVTLHVDLADWRRMAAGQQGPLRLREDWSELMEREGAEMSARLALNWALFPSRQQFSPGDYNWGMMSFDLAPGTVFDLVVVWYEDGERHVTTIDGIRCAADE